MKLFWAETKGVYLGAYTVILAETREEAIAHLDDELSQRGLAPFNPEEDKLKEIQMVPGAWNIWDGNY